MLQHIQGQQHMTNEQQQTQADRQAELAALSAEYTNIIERMRDLLDNHAYFTGDFANA